jgi:cell division transport system permease protein
MRAPAVQDAFDPYQDDGEATVAVATPRDERLYAEARTAKAEPYHKHAAIVPAGSVTGRSLTLVISIMCFLACLTSGAVFMINRSADGWLKDMASEVTVQLEPRDQTDTEKTLKDMVAFLAKEPGITNVKALTLDDSAALLEPWLGQADVLRSLPVPRLIALEIDRGSPPDLDSLRQRLSGQFKGASLDDHRHWQQQIRTVTRSFALGGFMILLLVAAATIAIIVSATRSSMASNRDIVEVLHFVGATDRFIAREFESHFLKLGIRAGLVGASAAGLVFLIAPLLVEVIGGQTVTATELRQLVGSGALELTGYFIMGLVVIVIAALCMLTSRLGVFGILNART